MKYDRTRVSVLLEKPYAVSLLISWGGYSESKAIFKTRNGESGNGNGERGTGNGESLKAGIFKMGNL